MDKTAAESLADIKARIADLTRQAEELVRLEKASVIEEVKRKVHDYGLTARDLGLDVLAPPPPKTRGRAPARSEKAEPKYRDEYGNEWAGGRGRKPLWVQKIIESGGDIEKYRIMA
ncbi:MAG: H-NS histone family protein [Gammaproteobacteria bacterium]|jgi:DNA-binding protein H-NS|nr:H-NS histone family protein [Candidatus Thioaporhodococcus sediminis]TNF52503.1 MAG: H-NS histone family protein [Gammaproteobacteria bacterium]